MVVYVQVRSLVDLCNTGGGAWSAGGTWGVYEFTRFVCVCLTVSMFFCLPVGMRVCVCARADWRSSDLSREWQKEENGLSRPHNTHRGCLYRPHTKRIYMVTDSSPSMYTKSACLATLPWVLCPRLSTPYDAVALFSWRPCGTLLTRQRFLWHLASSTIFFGTDNSNNRAYMTHLIWYPYCCDLSSHFSLSCKF